MTDPADPTRRRKQPSRQRPTIDLKARVIKESPLAPPGDEERAVGAVFPSAAPAGTPDEAADAITARGADETATTSEGSPGTAPADATPGDLSPDRAFADATGSATRFPRAETFVVDPASFPPDKGTADASAPIGNEDIPPDAGSAPQASEPLSPVSAAISARRTPAFTALAGAALLGGVVGAGAIYGLIAGFGSSPPPAALPDPRLAEIEQRLASLPRADLIQATEGRVRALEGARADLAQQIGAVRTLAERAAARAEDIANRPAAAAQPGIGATGAAADPAILKGLEDRLATLESQSRADAQAAAASVQALEKRVAEASQALERRLGEGEERVGALARRLADSNPQAIQAGLRVVLANRLNNALSEGAAFTEVLGSLRSLDIAPARLQALEPFAATGAPTAAALAEGFRKLGEQIVRDDRGEAGGIVDKILKMGSRIVSVRPLGGAGASSVPDLVARIEDALKRGALADAAAAFDALPEPARRTSEAWGRELKARIAAEKAARDIAAEALAALDAPPR